MKLVKSLLLGSAAGLVAVAGAQAADLPVRKAAPVDYVRVCTTYGAGYFFIPGTDTCLRISGFVHAEALYTTQEDDQEDRDNLGFRARFRLNFDARQPTEYGLLRAFIRIDIRRESGAYVTGGEIGAVAGGTIVSVDASRFPDQAYIQFGGLTAGRAQSFFDFYTGDDLFQTSRTTDDTKLALFAYTQTFGGGLSATISLEDNAERRLYRDPFGVAGFPGFAPVPAGFFTPGLGVTTFAPGGYEWPDVVANVRIDQAWGAAQLSGALHQVNPVNQFAPLGIGPAVIADEEWGWAVQAGVMFKLPFLAPGDEFWINAAYSEGAGSYNGLPGSATLERFTEIRTRQTDAFVDRFGNVQLTEVFSIAGKFKHYWLPNLRSNFHLGYADINYSGAGSTFLAPVVGGVVVAGPGVNVGFLDTRIFEASANLIWTPVRNLDIGVEALYRSFDVKGNTASRFAGTTFTAAGAPVVGPVRLLSDDDVIEARLRIARDF
jgi:hypothetical protein